MKVEFQGPAGKLEGILDEPENVQKPIGVAVVCHPHPLHEGTMRNTIVFRTARALRAVGFITLRFNFRGVEESEGVHDGEGAEEQDAAAAFDYLGERYPGLPMWGAGFSFGSRTMAGLAPKDARIERVVLVAFPVAAYDCSFIKAVPQPGFLIFGSVDEFGTLAQFRAQFPELPERLEVHEIEGADHFFRGRTPLMEEAIRLYALRSLGQKGQGEHAYLKGCPAIKRLMMPRDTNAFGTVFGGVILAEIDLAAAVESNKHHGGKMVTVAMDSIVFRAPVHVGDLVSFYTETHYVGTKSVRVKVFVWAERRFAKEDETFVTEAEVTMVAVDEAGNSIPLDSDAQGALG